MNKTQKLLADIATLKAAGASFDIDVTASASRNYGYYTVSITCTEADGTQAEAEYTGSTINKFSQKGAEFSEKLAFAVQRDVREEFACNYYRAGSRMASALREICDLLTETSSA